MKKSVPVLCCALLLALSAACSSGQPEAAAAYDPASTAQALLDSGAFSQELEALDADIIAPNYGLTDEPEEAVAYTSLEGGYEQLAVLKLADEAAAKTACDTLTAYVAAQKETEADVQYKPEDLPKLEQAVVKQAGNTVLLVVANDYAKADAALNQN